MIRPAMCLSLLLTPPLFSAPPDKPLPPKDAAKAMTLPKGFKATLFAGEPDVVQPIAFTFDDRGRLWVVECLLLSASGAATEGRAMIASSSSRTPTATASSTSGPSSSTRARTSTGIEYGFGGIWLCSAPNLLFIPIKDGEDKPAGPPQVILDGWNWATIQHNIFNGLTWGPDGWLYGCNGITSTSFVGKPGTPEKERQFVNCGVWRYHPTKKTFEVFANGTTNPWGIDFDDYGEMFITNCVIAHLWHVVPGAHFERMHGQDPNPYVYGLMKTCADHLHWAGGHWTDARGGKEHSEAGGGHAHVGCMIYLGDNWPDEYRNGVFMCNLHGNRINHDILERKGSGYVAHHGKDFLFANDPWFRGLALKYGPDGGVFVTDWTDTGECHNHKEVDRTNGRIFKVTYGTPKPWKGDLAKLSDAELVKLQTHKNDWFVRHARRLLQERAAAGKLMKQTTKQLLEMMCDRGDVRKQLRATWALHVIGHLATEEEIWVMPQGGFDHDDRLVAWWLRLWVETCTENFFLEGRMEANALFRGHEPVKLIIASCLPHAPRELAWRVALVLCSHEEIAADPNLSLMTWYGVEPLVPTDPKRALHILETAKIPLVREYLTRRLATLAGVKDPLPPILDFLSKTKDNSTRLDILRGIQEALSGRRSVPLPHGWDAAYAKLSASENTEVRERATTVAVLFDDPKAFAALTATVRDKNAESAARERELQHLVFKAKPGVLLLLKDLLTDRTLAAPAIRGLATFDDPQTPRSVPETLCLLERGPSRRRRRNALLPADVCPSFAHRCRKGAGAAQRYLRLCGAADRRHEGQGNHCETGESLG